MKDIEDLKEGLNTKILGRNIIYLKDVGSTQDYIKNMLKTGAAEGLVVITDNQTKGKGTNGRTWYTEMGKNLTFSFLLKPNCNIKKLSNLTIVIAEVIVKAIKKLYGCKLEIKYPNDIMISNKKLGGILTETYTLGENIENLVIRYRAEYKSN